MAIKEKVKKLFSGVFTEDSKIDTEKLKTIRLGTRRGVGERRYHREDIIKPITKL